MLIVDPRPEAVARSMVAKTMPPLWQYLRRLLPGTRADGGPQRARILDPLLFSLQMTTS
jgi:ABC-type uncharacterized transport system YnjBCD substrate-binding protein